MWNLDRRILAGFIILLLLAFTVGIKYGDIKAQRQNEQGFLTSDLTADDVIEVQPDAADQEEPQIIQVYVTGQVANPGVYKLEQGARVYEVVELAGGARENADLTVINMARELVDGETILIQAVGEEITNSSLGSSGISALSSGSSKININQAAAGEMAEKLNGIGPVLAERIIEYRETHGPFKSIEDIKNVSGIGDKKFESIKDDISIR